MSKKKRIKIGTLGSVTTFAGGATSRMREEHPEYSEPVYFSSMEDCWTELKKGTVDAVILGLERTGQPYHGDQLIANGFYVIGESSQPLNCSLYVKRGTRKSDIRKITGHGAIHQCASYLDREFPGIPREQHGLNSFEAAKAALASDGTIAVVGTQALACVETGLEEIATDIDDGAICSWGVISTQPLFSDEPSVVVIASRCGRNGQLGALIAAIKDAGYELDTAAPFPVNSGVSVYDYVLTFGGKGTLGTVKETADRFDDTRLVGAFDKRG